MFTLRMRLLISYLLLLAITLGIVATTFFLAISSRPSPPQPTYQRLADFSQGINQRDLLREFAGQGNNPDGISIINLLDRFAEAREVRVLIIDLKPDAPNKVQYDSAGVFQREEEIRLRLDSYRVVRIGPNQLPNVITLFGLFDDNGTEWLFSGAANIDLNGQIFTILIADIRPTQSLQQVLADMDNALLPPILQAGSIGLIIALTLAVFISRTIAHPLQAASAAATAVAEGDLNQHVPVSGPPEVRAVAKAFNHMSARVRATQQSQRDFMANVSHDLKTPLTSIQGYSQAIIDGTEKKPEHAAEIIHDEAGRLNRMVIELTDLARIQAGQLSMQMTTIDIGQIVYSVANRLAVVAENKQIELKVDTLQLPPILGDGDRLVQSLDNLIGNAIKYTHSGGTVEIQTTSNKDNIEISIHDTGIGLSQSDLPRIFERFYQVDKARGPSRGTGLGLAITNEIIQAHGGHITVQSMEKRGTTFKVFLPRNNADTIT
jgi:signal transduction histidine kinase